MQTSIFSKVFSDRSLSTAIDLAAEIGYDGVEPMAREPHLGPDTTPERAREIRARYDDHGLEMPAIATYTGGYTRTTDAEREKSLETLEQFLKLTEILECDLLRHSPGGPSVHEATDEDFKIAATWMRRAADLAAEYDATLAMEIHAGRLTETTTSTMRLLELVDRPNLGAIHDAGNMYLVDTDFGPETVERLGDDLLHVHVKDELRVDDDSLPGAFELENRHGTELFQPRLLGEGAVDHRPLFRALAESGYDGFVTAECSVPPDDPNGDVEVARHEHEVLNTYIADV